VPDLNIDKRSIVEKLEKNLRYIAEIIKQKGREILNGYSLTPPQFVALQWLYESGDMTIGELSGKMYLAFSTTTDLMDRMEKNELVQRIRDPQDRRVVRIQLLAKGGKIIQEVIKKRQDYLYEVLSNSLDHEISSLGESLFMLHQEMNKE
jgi:DNA-binding MarR family transcriptional regulator